MEKRVLGRTGLWVSTLGIGAGQYGAFGKTTESDCICIAHAGFDGGVNLIDTADFYSFGESETIVGKVIADRRDRIILATKCGMPMSDDPNERGASRRWLRASVERSLRRLGTDYIDLYQCHQPDPATPIEETVEAMTELVREGKIRYFGLSNSPAALVTEAVLRGQLRGAGKIQSEQSAYSIFNRRPEAELLPACEALGVGFLAYSPLDGGWLGGRLRAGVNAEATARQRLNPTRFDLTSPANGEKLQCVEALGALAAEAGLALPHMGIAFVLSHRAVTSALVGGSSLEQMQAHLAGQDVRLADDVLDRIDAIVTPGVNMPEAPNPSPALKDASLRRRSTKTVGPDGGRGEFFRTLVADEKTT